MGYDIFISYSRKDTATVDRICDALDRAGITYFIDRKSIHGGMEFPAELARAIESSKLFLYIASKNSYSSKFTLNEITFAFNEMSRQSMLPYIIDNSKLPSDLKFIFAGINWRSIKEHPIDTVLIDDLLKLLGRESSDTNKKTNPRTEKKQQRTRITKPPKSYKKALISIGIALISLAIIGAIFHRLTKYNTDDLNQALQEDNIELITDYAELDSIRAQQYLAYLYIWGDEPLQNYDLGYKWAKKAAKNGSDNDKCILGICYYYGVGVNINYAKASNLFDQLARKGHIGAQCMIGECWENGRGVQQSAKQAAAWYKIAADNGSDIGQYRYARCLEHGIGVKQDFYKAYDYYKLAADQGNEDAKKRIYGDNYNEEENSSTNDDEDISFSEIIGTLGVVAFLDAIIN